MIPKKGQQIVIYLRSGIQLSGIVEFWGDGKSSIKSQEGTSTTVLQKTIEDVLFYKILNLKKDYETLAEKPIKEKDDIKKIAELKNEMNALDRLDLRDKMSSHEPGGMREIQYGIPGINATFAGSLERTGEKTSRSNPEFSSELQNLFNQKH